MSPKASPRSRRPPPALIALGKLVLSSHPLRHDNSHDARRQLLADFIKLLGGLPFAEKKLPAAVVIASVHPGSPG